MKTLRLIILAFVLAIPARAQVHLLVTTNGLILAPPGFFGTNIATLTNALNDAGYSPGGGSGNASTNASQGWASTVTNTFNGRVVFLGDTLAGSTNLVAKLAALEALFSSYQPLDTDLTAIAAIAGAAGDILYHNGTNWVKLTIGGDGLVLKATNGLPVWGAIVGTGDVVGPASSTDSVVALFDGTTGKLLKNGTLTEAAINAHLTEAEASALYQKTNSVLTTLATLDGSALTNLNASSIASGTLSSNRLPADIALTTLTAGTLTATSVSGDGSGLTNLNGSNIASGTVAAARIDTAIARTNAPALHSPTLLGSPTVPTAAAGTSNTVAASTKYVDDAVAAAPGGSSPTTTRGDLIVRGASADERLAVGEIGSTLTSNGTDPIWGNVSTVISLEEEFFGTATPAGWSTTGTATYSTAGNNFGDSNHLGVVRLRYTTAAGGIYSAQSAVALGGGILVWDAIHKQANLSDTNDPIVVLIGLHDSGTATNSTDGVFFMSNQGLYSGNWAAVTRSNTVETVSDTGVAVTTGWQRLSCIINNAASATFYINGSAVATNTTNLPLGSGRETGLGFIAAKTSGSTERNHYLDVMRMLFFPTVGR